MKIFAKEPKTAEETATMRLMRSWLEEDAASNPTEEHAAEEDLREFKRNMNLPCKESRARLLYPEAESAMPFKAWFLHELILYGMS